MKFIFNQYRFTLLCYVVIFLVAAFIQSSYAQIAISLNVNGIWNAFFDFFFNYITYLGDGYITVLIGLVVLSQNRKLGWGILISYAVSALITQFLKHYVFFDMNRPSWVHKDSPFHFVNNVEVFAFNTFPSGHSTTAFALATFLSLYFNKKGLSVLFFSSAILVALSRIYLVQHFFQDTYAASFIGFSTACLVYYFINRKELLHHDEIIL